jgi:hypothetical protein
MLNLQEINYIEFCRLDHGSVYRWSQQTFLRNMSAPYAVSKHKSSKKSARSRRQEEPFSCMAYYSAMKKEKTRSFSMLVGLQRITRCCYILDDRTLKSPLWEPYILLTYLNWI